MDNLNLSEENYEKMLDLTQELLCISDIEGKFRYVNPAFEKIMGYSTKDMIGLNLHHILHPEDMIEVRSEIQSLIEERNDCISFEFRCRCKNGIYKLISWNSKIDFQEKLVYSSGRDITEKRLTERKKHEEELRTAKGRLLESQHFAHLGSWEFNEITKEYTWSDELFRIYGFDPQEFIPTVNDLLKLTHPDDKKHIDNVLRKHKDNSICEFDYRIITRDNQRKWIHQKMVHTYDAYGKPFRKHGIVQDITQRKLDQEKIKESEERYKELASNLPVGVLSYDINGNITFANQKTVEILGSPSIEAIMAVNVFTLPIFNQNNISDVYKKCIESGKLIITERQTISKWGKSLYERVLATPIKDADGNVISGIGIIEDFTERKRNEEESQRTRERLTEAQEFAHLGYWELDEISGKSLWSDELFRIYGFEPQEFIPTTKEFIKLIHPEDKEFITSIVKETQCSNEFGYDFRVVTQDNRIIWVHEKAKFGFDASGRRIRVHGVVKDITLQKLSEAKLKESEERYKELANNVPVGILSYDLNGNVTFINPKVIEILGSPSEEATMSINLFTFYPLIQNGASDTFKQCLESGKLITAEKQYNSKWGKALTLRIQVTPIKDDNDQVVSGVAIIENFTERKKLEKDLQSAKEQAEMSNKAKSQFLANMSHEIRTPMNGIMGMSDLLLYSDITDDQRFMVNIVKKSSNSLLQIINAILDLSKIEAGKVELTPEHINIVSFIDNNAKMYTALANDKNLILTTEIQRDVPKEIFVDTTRLNQVITNLLGNAIKFTQKGEINLKVKRIKAIENKTELMFSIHDTGIGIKEEDIAKLFNYFTQLDDSRTKQFQGTGLGLAISKSIVGLMGGELFVESIWGKGSTFYFTIWVDTAQKENKINSSQGTQALLQSQKNINILLVEDDYVSQMVISGMCKMLNMNIGIASNGKEALKILVDRQFDIILMDIQMPEMSGIQVTKAIREKEKLTRKHVPIIATTAYAMSQDKKDAINAGMDDYISKPIDLTKLKELIERWTK